MRLFCSRFRSVESLKGTNEPKATRAVVLVTDFDASENVGPSIGFAVTLSLQ